MCHGFQYVTNHKAIHFNTSSGTFNYYFGIYRIILRLERIIVSPLYSFFIFIVTRSDITKDQEDNALEKDSIVDVGFSVIKTVNQNSRLGALG